MVGWRQAAPLAVIALAVLSALVLTGAAIADDGEQAAAGSGMEPPVARPLYQAAFGGAE